MEQTRHSTSTHPGLGQRGEGQVAGPGVSLRAGQAEMDGLVPGNIWLEKGSTGRAREGGEGELQRDRASPWRGQSVRRFPGGEDAAWAGDSRFARKVRSLCLALPFLESEAELKAGRGTVGRERLHGGVERSLAGRERFAQGSHRPFWLSGISLPEEKILRNPHSLLFSALESSHPPSPILPCPGSA